MPKTSQLTPMLRHYLEVKQEHPDCLLFYRMGDFYELFFEDAEEAAPILEVTLTARQKGTESEAPMCGVPHHAVDSYAGRLLKAGYKVALCDQVEDPAEARGLVKREVTRILTPGTISEPALLDGKEANQLVAIAWDGEAGAGAFLDISTGALWAQRWDRPESALDALRAEHPREAVLASAVPERVARWAESQTSGVSRLDGDEKFDSGRSAERLERHFGTATLRGFGLDPREPATTAVAAALHYAEETQRRTLQHVRGVRLREPGDSLVLDPVTLDNLEIVRTVSGKRAPTLLSTVDRSKTAQGGRLLRRWLRSPRCDVASIERRLDAVQELLGAASVRDEIRILLAEVGDPERLLGRASLGTLTPPEAAALRHGLGVVPDLLARISDCRAGLLAEVAETDPAAALHRELTRRLREEPSGPPGEGGVIADGFDAALDEARGLTADAKGEVLRMQATERERTGIDSLKIRFNKVHGYYIEVTKPNLERVPDEYERKQTLTNAERYITPELKQLEEQILTAEERLRAREVELFEGVLELVVEHSEALQGLGAALATIDVLATFAELAARRDYVRPGLLPGGRELHIQAGRHPVLERLGGEEFVPNDCELDGESTQVVLLTGPNMGGKSTWLRQVAQIVILAQAGSFVPADRTELSLVDRIFTRVGASDNLARGESTFMTEMIETANILHNATDDSLIVLDEVGRGTATFDGLSLAWAIVEHLHRETRARTLFATHYHELTELASLLPRVVNRTMAVKEWQDRIVFLRKVVPGKADRSYGLHVAELAGVPDSVVDRAREILANLESQEFDAGGRPRLTGGSDPEDAAAAQIPLFTPAEEVVARAIREAEIEQMTPLAALNLLHSLKSRLE